MSLVGDEVCMLGVVVVVGSGKLCGTSASTVTRVTRALLLWCWALHSQLVPLAVLARLT